MAKEIEIILCGDPLAFKVQLENMVNDGWDIKGIYNFIDRREQSFMVLQREKDESIPAELLVRTAEGYFLQMEPIKNEISISMGPS